VFILHQCADTKTTLKKDYRLLPVAVVLLWVIYLCLAEKNKTSRTEQAKVTADYYYNK